MIKCPTCLAYITKKHKNNRKCHGGLEIGYSKNIKNDSSFATIVLQFRHDKIGQFIRDNKLTRRIGKTYFMNISKDNKFSENKNQVNNLMRTLVSILFCYQNRIDIKNAAQATMSDLFKVQNLEAQML